MAVADRLRGLTLRLLQTRVPAWQLHEAVAELADLLGSLAPAEIRARRDIAFGESRTPNGLAISPVMAAMCADDFARTIQLLRGIHAAIREARERIPDRPVRVLYAGCGPYAILAVPLMAVLSPDEVVFTILDVHAISVDSARSVVESSALSEFVDCFMTVDATSYQVDVERSPDIVLVEVMQACLELEPQVAVTRHPLRQAPDAILLPQEVRIDLELVDVARKFDPDALSENREAIRRDRVPLGPVFLLNRDSVRSWEGIVGAQLPGATVRIPDQLEPRYQPLLFTVITVYGGQMLRAYDSGLACPRQLTSGEAVGSGDTIRFHYELGAHPRLVAGRRQQGVGETLAATR